MPGPEQRPMPADFAADVGVMTRKELRQKYQAGYSTIDRWVAQSGAPMRPRQMPEPADFQAMAPTMTLNSLSSHYKVHREVVRRWLGESNMAKTPPRRVLPHNIAEIMADNSVRSAAKFMGWHESVLRKHLKRDRPDLLALGKRNGALQLAAAGRNQARRARVAKPVANASAPARKPTGWKLPVNRDIQIAPRSRADEAMRWMQRFGPCYPMRVHNRVLDDYCVCGRRMEADAVVAEAYRRGWNPDAWREVAA